MKTIEDIKNKISQEIEYCFNESDPKKNKKSKEAITYFRGVILYLETFPSEGFVLKEIGRLEKIIQSKESYVKSLGVNKKIQSEILSSFDIPRIKKQVDTLKYILS